jgi:hypothetical protein
MQAAYAGVAVVDFRGRHIPAAAFKDVKTLLVQRLPVRQADFYAACFVFQWAIISSRFDFMLFK